MKRSDKILIVAEGVLSTLIILSFLFYNNIPSITLNVIFILVIGGLSLLMARMFGFKKVNAFKQKPIIKTMCIVLMAALIVCFNVGLIVGFSRTFFPLNVQRVTEGVIPVLLLAIFMEILRSSVVVASGGKRPHLIAFTLILSIVDIILETNESSFMSIESTFVTTCTIILPAIAAQMLLFYLNINAGTKVSLSYRLITGLYLYILPIIPSLGNYLYSVLWLSIPYLIFIISKKTLANIGEIEHPDIRKNRLSFSFLSIPLFIFLMTLAILVSGVFNYKMIAVASGSMEPAFSRGDAVIYEKTDQLSPGDVLAFSSEGKIITHRIIKEKNIDEEVAYITQGDANAQPDGTEVKKSQILGKVRYVIKYIGFPTVWINEKIGNII